MDLMHHVHGMGADPSEMDMMMSQMGCDDHNMYMIHDNWGPSAVFTFKYSKPGKWFLIAQTKHSDGTYGMLVDAMFILDVKTGTETTDMTDNTTSNDMNMDDNAASQLSLSLV